MRRRALLGAALGAPALAQEAWPARSLRWIVPYPPGGSSDFIARVAAERIRDGLRLVPVIVERR